MAAWCYVWRKANGWVLIAVKEFGEAERLARRAVTLGKDDAVALARGGHALAYVVGEFDAGKAFTDQALLLNPNFAVGWMLSGLVSVYRGEPDEAIKSSRERRPVKPARSTHLRGADCVRDGILLRRQLQGSIIVG